MTDDLTVFLETLYGDLDAPGLLELRALPSRRQVFVPLVEIHVSGAVEAFLADCLAAQENAFFGVAVRYRCGGTKNDCSLLTALYCDLDLSPSLAHERLAAFPCPPTLIVHSGGGVHAYWRLKEAIDVRDDWTAIPPSPSVRACCACRARAISNRSTRLHRRWRLFTERYDLLDLDLVLPEDVRDTRSAAPPSSNGRRLTPGHRHRYLLSKAGTLHRAGLTRDAILACLLEENRHRCDPPKADADIRALVDDLTTRYAPDPYTAHVDRVAAEQTEAPPPILSPLDDAVLVAAEGRDIATRGVQYLVPDLVPDYGVLGMSVAFSKVGKTTLAQSLAAAVATGAVFLDRQTRRRRVLVLAVEDPPEYTAYLARRFCVPEGTVTFHRQPLQLDPAGLARIIATVQHGAYGLVLAASWQAMVSGLVRDENDNAGAVTVVERVKAATRQCGIPWLIDAHAGKGEDQSDDADPTRALRGASAAAGAADFMLSLRYARGPFSTERRLSGKGRFVQLAPIVIDYQPESGLYVVLGDSKSAMRETTWAILTETGALTHEWQTAGTIAAHAGLVASTSDASHTVRRHVAAALTRRPGVDVQTVAWRDRTVTQYRRAAGEPA